MALSSPICPVAQRSPVLLSRLRRCIAVRSAESGPVRCTLLTAGLLGAVVALDRVPGRAGRREQSSSPAPLLAQVVELAQALRRGLGAFPPAGERGGFRRRAPVRGYFLRRGFSEEDAPVRRSPATARRPEALTSRPRRRRPVSCTRSERRVARRSQFLRRQGCCHLAGRKPPASLVDQIHRVEALRRAEYVESQIRGTPRSGRRSPFGRRRRAAGTPGPRHDSREPARPANSRTVALA